MSAGSDGSVRTAGVLGVGATGARAARQLASADAVDVVVLGGTGERPVALQRSLGSAARIGEPIGPDVGVVVLAGPAGTHVDAARRAIELGSHVVSTSDAVKSRVRFPLPARNSAGVVASFSDGTLATITCLSCGM